MSIFFAVSGKAIPSSLEKIQKTDIFSIYKEENLIILASGQPPKFLFKQDENGFLFLGLPVIEKNNSYQLINQNNLENLIYDYESAKSNLNAHFTILNWNKDNFRVYNDLLGVNQFFHFTHKNAHIFSNSLALILKYSGLKEFDFFNLSSRIYLNNQLDESSIFDKIDRMGAGTFIEINRNFNSMTVKKSKIEWSFEKLEPEQFHNLISSSSNLEFENKNLAIALSGGIDSRYILSNFIKNKKNPTLISYGMPEHPDNIISKKIADKIGLKHIQFSNSNNYVEISEDMILQFSLDNQLQNSLSEIISKSFYSMIETENFYIVDGGIGEFGRRGYFTLAGLIGFRSFKSRDVNEILNSYFIKKSISFFNEELQKQIVSNTKHKLKIMIDTMPDMENIDFQNWIDLFGIRIKYPNFMHYEQQNSDKSIINFSPFNFLKSLQTAMKIPVTMRSDAKLYKEFIIKSTPELKQFQLVKHNRYYPFSMNQTLGKLYIKAGELFRKPYQDNSKINFYQKKKQFFADIINTILVSEAKTFNTKFVNQLLNEYQNNNFQNEKDLDSLITYCVYRYAIGRNNE